MNITYLIFPAIRRGFGPSRMTSNNLISPMKFCYKTNSTLPKQCQSSRSVLQDGSRTFGLFWKEKTPSYNRRNTVCILPVSGEKSPGPGTPETTRRVHSGPKERTPIPVEERGEGDGIEAPPHRAPSSASVRSPPSR